jgi:2-dehydropantoate 2-reductase
MRIAVMGSGGMGGYYGALLAQHQHEVALIARGPHLLAIQKNGLEIKSVFGDFVVKPVAATDRPADVGVVDLVLVCTKTYDTDEAAQALLPMVGPETTVLSLQNGIDAADRVGRVVGMQRMLAGTTWISAAVERPGIIRQSSEFRRVVAGERSGEITRRLVTVVDAFGQTGIAAEASHNIEGVLWQKFVFIAAASGVGSLTRLPLGEYRAVPETRRMIVALMREVQAVARARGVKLSPDAVDAALEFMDQAGPHIKASMQLDVEAGRRTELESLIGVIGREGSRLGIPTPVADMVLAALLPRERLARRTIGTREA